MCGTRLEEKGIEILNEVNENDRYRNSTKL